MDEKIQFFTVRQKALAVLERKVSKHLQYGASLVGPVGRDSSGLWIASLTGPTNCKARAEQ